MKRKSHVHSAAENQERWLVSYADLITLLFALFVILYAMSRLDLEKMKKVNQSMRDAFGDSPVAPQHQTTSVPAPPGGKTDANSNAISESRSSESAMLQTQEKIQQVLASENGAADLADKVNVIRDDRGLVVRLAAQDFFDDGIVEARAELRPVLDRIGKVLATVSNSVRVEGHTDIEETAGGAHRDMNDWALSTGRAAWVLEYWIKRWGIDPARLSAAGFSHFHPLTQRKDDYSRGKNRRIEVVVLR